MTETVWKLLSTQDDGRKLETTGGEHYRLLDNKGALYLEWYTRGQEIKMVFPFADSDFHPRVADRKPLV